ncbi:phage tail tape measure protein [Pseudomonas shirazensis]|uniref:phage tail tape measure protein n=1 Tax=Pseudomonas shirazensis TaxID=2745494 RepID=UPI001644AABA|nr:phage tail tape measure protein [Pseudomonas shirazensis]MBV4500366.1 phage tail tape measure protein [Pseudomonas shirazensis]
MTTIASLGLQIDSGDAVEAKDNLDQLTDAGKRSEESAGKTGRAWEAALGSLQGDTRQIVQELQALNAKQAELAQQMATVSRAVTTASTAFSSAAANMGAFRAEAAQAGQAQAALTTATDAGAQAGRRAAETTEEQQSRLLAMARASLEASEYVQSLNRATAQTVEVTGQANAVLSDNASRQAAINSRAQALLATEERLAQSAKSSAAAQRDQGQALDELLGKIDPTVAAMGRLDAMEQKLKGFRASGALDAEAFGEYQTKIDQARTALGAADSALGKTGMTAKATAAALRGVPAQFTDIFTSIAAGQPITMVALQQGGQLKDMFGGLGPAARALGGYILGLITPLTVSAAAAVALGYAFYKGTEETDAYSNALVLTGNSAGLTADQLGSLAKQVSATVGTTGAAASVLASLAGSGKIAGDSFMDVAQAAVSMEEATGKAVSETIAEFVKLADDPVKASVALNTQYNYLTSSVYSQITALEQQGKHAEAVKLATEAFADAINERTPKIIENLSWWERGYNAVAKAADNLKNIGRSSIDDDIARMEENLASAQRGDVGAFQNQKEMVTFYTDQLQFLKDKKAAQEDIAAFDRQEAEANEKTIKAMAKVDALEKSAWTNSKKRSEELKEYEKSLDVIRKKNPDDARLNPETIEKVRSNIAEKYKDPAGRPGTVDLAGFNNQKNALAAILAEYKNNQKELDATQKAGLISQESYAAQRAAIVEQQKAEVTNAYEAEIKALEDAKARSSTSAQQRIQLDQKIADARAAMVKAQKDADTELSVLATNEQGRLAKQERAISSYVQALEQQQRALELAGQRAVVGVGRGDRQNALNGELNTQQDRYAQQVLDLENQRSDPSRNMSEAEFERKSQALASANKKATDQIQQNYADVEAAQGDWTKGASAAWENYLDSAKNIAGQTKTLFGNAFSSMEDSIVNFAMTGKASFADFARSIIADMARIAARQAASGLLGGLVNLGVSAASAYFGGGSGNGMEAGSAGAVSSNLGASQAGYGSAYFPQALGGAWSQGVQMFADGGAFTNSIVSTPTAFGMAGGRMGVMGEAGDEAVMPLTRTAGGQLGVRAVGGGGGTSISMPMSLTLVTEDRSGEGMQLDQQALQQNMQAQMKAAGEKAVADSWRPGGISYRNSQGRR